MSPLWLGVGAAVLVASLGGCSSEHARPTTPATAAHSAPVAGEGTPVTTAQTLYARVKTGVDPLAVTEFTDRINADPAAYGLYYRAGERLVAINININASAAQVRHLQKRLDRTGWFSKLLVGRPDAVPDAIFSDPARSA